MVQHQKSFLAILKSLMIETVPKYANKIYYSLGFLAMTSFLILIITGVFMAFHGPNWWLTSSSGIYFRSVHLWATQAFVVFMLLHLIIVFCTSGFKPPRRLTWVLGALMFVFVLAEAEFGYVLRGDFSAQWRSLQGADLYNGSGIGAAINNLNFVQIYGIHIVLIPIIIIGLLFLHYLLIRVRGIAKPYRSDEPTVMVKARHGLLFLRGAAVVAAVLILAAIFPSPYIEPTSVTQVAKEDPKLIGNTLMQEYSATSGTATYTDNISPYTGINTRTVYVLQPYAKLVSLTHIQDRLTAYNAEPNTLKDRQAKAATDYFDKGSGIINAANHNPLISVISSLIIMGQSGLYEADLAASGVSGDTTTDVTRFLADTGVMDTKAQNLNITTDQYGMLREEKGNLPPGAWWLAPIGLLDHTLLKNDNNQDRDGAIIIGVFWLLLIAFPYIPLLNRLPDKLKIYKLIWR